VTRTSERPADENESQDDVTPMAPLDLARGYATLAFELHETLKNRLDEFEKGLKEAQGMALAAHGLIVETRDRIEDIAAALKIPDPTRTEKAT
jgi:hypothetical protein